MFELRSRRNPPFESSHPFLTGALAGLAAGGVAGQSDRLLDRFISPRQKRRDRRVREGSAHELAGPFFARKITGRRLSRKAKRRARATFGLAYGIVWGLVYTAARHKAPRLSRWGGLPFAVPFFFACDGVIAPLLGVSPGLRKVPWQPSVKELGNHVAWTATAEAVHRAAARYSSCAGRR